MANRQLDEEAIFHVARGLDDRNLRSTYLDQVCAGDQALRDRVVSLLEVHEREQNFLKSADAEPNPTMDASPLSERPGTAIGRYRLMEQIGEGGMGTVFVAEQERPIRRKVALKVIKPGMDSKTVVARFEAERQALAMMDHPNIAKVLDAGTTETGRPYFAMELVKGIPITEYCDTNKLTIRERLDLFVQVCQAIQHAHQKGIIHRDLKPSNVLVTLHDGEPVPKIIDFGVAKAVNARLTDKTIYTAHAQIVGTLLYMSPEQAEFSGLDVDTRSDIYSLGVVLYELLTGTTPFRQAELDKAGFDEQRRIIRQKEPPRASARISSLGATASTVADFRRTDPKKLNQTVSGDLDWILVKSLEKDRTRRYETATGFAADVRRYLTQQPIEARPPSKIYRLSRFAKRNRTVVGTSIVLILGAIIALAAIVRENKKAREERRQAQAYSQELETTINEYHGLLIESALLHAVLGDIDRVRATIGATQDEKFPADWRMTLQGVAYLHAGDNERAIGELEEAVERNKENISANAMLSLAYFHNGDWEKWIQHVAPLKDAQPSRQYEDFDTLFLGYAWFYIDYRESIGRFRAVMKKHPMWVFPRTMLASALAHQAANEHNEELIREALECVEVPMALADDNRFMLMQCLFVHSQAIAVLGDSSGEFERTAYPLAKELDNHPDYVVGSLVRAVYYDRIGQSDKAMQACKDVLDHGSGMLVHWPAAFFLRNGMTREITSRKWADPEGLIARAYILASSSDPDEQDEAQRIVDQLKPSAESWFFRHLLVQIPLLLREEAQAQELCAQWMKSGGRDLSILAAGSERESIRFLADPLRSPLNVNSSNLPEKFSANFQTALLRYSQGDVDGAIQYLDACPPLGAGFWQWWAEAFREHFRRTQTTAGQHGH